MSNITYVARLTTNQFVQVELASELPDFIHAVKYNHDHHVELIFDANYDWTSELEDEAMSLLTHSSYQYLPVYDL